MQRFWQFSEMPRLHDDRNSKPPFESYPNGAELGTSAEGSVPGVV